MTFYTHPTQPLTSIYHKEALKKDKKQLLIFIPGNPGLIDYYTTYLDLIQKQFPCMEILNISHAGYQTTDNFVEKGTNSKFEFYDLQYQVQHKVEIIKEFISQQQQSQQQEEKIEIFILCHSMGAYVVQRMVHSMLEKKHNLEHKIDIKFVGLICPTILDIKISQSGVFFSRLISILPLVHLALFAVWVIKIFLSETRIKKIIATKLVGKDNHESHQQDEEAKLNLDNSVVATYNLISSNRIIRQALYLAEEEMAEITQHDEINDFFFNQLTANGVKIWAFFADSDYWVHDKTRDSIIGKYYDAKNKNLHFQLGQPQTITHSFCVNQNKQFAHITCEALMKAFGGEL